MIKQRKIELLAPAKDLQCGIEAVNHGADAVYIGAPRFSARAAAANSVEEIATLVSYAHIYNVRVYVALNTILKDEELPLVEKMIEELYRVGVDALIIQDVGITRLNLPPIPLHGSTQMDIQTAEKVRFLAEVGFAQVILARELSLQEIASIHQTVPDIPLEVFVHGALCVSYSGQCYASEACFKRSANRGECAQFCRLPFNLIDSDGKMILHNKYLLSLKDLNRSEYLEALLDAGVTSLKIEGRLKECSYVKNITAAYRQALDSLFARRKEYVRAASGNCHFYFTPQLDKSFNRGFTSYFLQGREREVTSFDTPKSIGEKVGELKAQRGNCLTVAGVKSFHNGDGLCFLDKQGVLQGFRVNRVEGNKLYLAGTPPRIPLRTPLYRNFDQAFERLLSRKSSERKVGVALQLTDTAFGFSLAVVDEDGNRVALSFPCLKERARSSQEEELRQALSKWGDTPFELSKQVAETGNPLEIHLSDCWFIPISVVNGWRRKITERLLAARRINYRQRISIRKVSTYPFPLSTITYLGNVMNRAAHQFYLDHGALSVASAYEKQPLPGAVLMFCKHCLRYSMGWCPRHQKEISPYREPYYLVSNDKKRFRLLFDCVRCRMKIEFANQAEGRKQL